MAMSRTERAGLRSVRAAKGLRRCLGGVETGRLGGPAAPDHDQARAWPGLSRARGSRRSRSDGTERTATSIRVALRRLALLVSVALLVGGLCPRAGDLGLRAWPVARAEAPVHDALSLAYLRAFVSQNPADASRRVQLAREELALGLVAEAERTIAPLLAGGGQEALRLGLEVSMAAWRAIPANGPGREVAAHQAVERLERFLASSPADVGVAAAAARELGRAELAVRASVRAAETDPANAPRLLGQAGRDLLAARDPAGAAEMLAAASERASDGPQRRALCLEAVGAFEAANRGGQALAVAERCLGHIPEDGELSRAALRLARAQGQASRARDLGRRLLGPAPSPAALEQQLALELAAGAGPGALELAEKLAREGGGPERRREAARIAMWLNRPAAALDHWIDLARRGDAGAFEEARRIAEALTDASAAEALLRMSHPVGDDALESLCRTVDVGGGADRTASTLRARLRRHPEQRRAWELLADAEERRGDVRASLAATDEVARRFGPDLSRSVRAARQRWSLGERSVALQNLAGIAGDVPSTQLEYWRLLAALAWESEERALAARAYGILWASGAGDALGAERLILLDRDAGRTAEAIQVGRAAWTRLREPRLLLLAADTAAETQRWDDLGDLLDAATPRESEFTANTHYWLLRARLREVQGRTAESLEEYRRALGVDPRSSPARAGVVWLLVGAGKWQPLADALEGWYPDAWEDPSLWRPWAAGLDALGRGREAAAFRARAAQAAPGGEPEAAGRASAEPPPRLPPEPVSRAGAGDAGSRIAGGRADSSASARIEHWAERWGPLAAQRTLATGRSDEEDLAVDLQVERSAWSTSLAAGRSLPDDLGALLRVSVSAHGGRIELGGGAGIRGREQYARLAAALEAPVAAGLRARLDGLLNETADESASLRADALRSRAAGTLAWSRGQAAASTTLTWRRWSVVGGAPVGQGWLWAADAGWHPSFASRLYLQLHGSWQANRLRQGAAEVLSRRWGMAVLPAEAGTLGVSCTLAPWRRGKVELSGSAWAGIVWPQPRPGYRVQAAIAVDVPGGGALSLGGFAGDDPWRGMGDRAIGLSFIQHFWR